MKTILTFLSLIPVLLLTGCGVNELAKYDLTAKPVLYSYSVSRNAAQIQIVTEDPANKKEDKSVLGVLAEIGSEILSEDSRDRLEEAVDTDELASYISAGLEAAMKSYLNTKSVESLDDDPVYLVETNLDECKLWAKENGVSVYVQATGRIIDRASGKLVWENSESQTIPVEASYSKSKTRTEAKVFNAIQLAALDEDEINLIVGTAAENVGKDMAETFREDLVESREK